MRGMVASANDLNAFLDALMVDEIYYWNKLFYLVFPGHSRSAHSTSPRR